MTQPERLEGGSTSEVVRVGEEVHRGAGRWTPAVHALLTHLRSGGFTGVPEPLRVEDGREVLRFVPGEVGTLSQDEPLSSWFGSDEACGAIGDWLRRYHAAQAGFRPDPALPWRRCQGRALVQGEVVVHHDVSPYNTVRRPDGGLTVIDWDFARPGDPLQDLAWAAWRWVPLMAPGTHRRQGYAVELDVAEQAHRLCVLADAYGASGTDRGRLLGVLLAEITGHATDLEELAATDPAFARLVDLGYARDARADAAWLDANRPVLEARLVTSV